MPWFGRRLVQAPAAISYVPAGDLAVAARLSADSRLGGMCFAVLHLSCVVVYVVESDLSVRWCGGHDARMRRSGGQLKDGT